MEDMDKLAPEGFEDFELPDGEVLSEEALQELTSGREEGEEDNE